MTGETDPYRVTMRECCNRSIEQEHETGCKSQRRHRSVSQINQYDRCPYSYKLSRIDKVWEKPAAWLPQGSAVHTVAEHVWRRKLEGLPVTVEDAQVFFAEEYAKEVSKYTEITPNFDFWFASGPYRGAADVERRYGIGLEQVRKFIEWTDNHPEEEIWFTPGLRDSRCKQLQVAGSIHHVDECECKNPEPAIELAFDIDLDGVLVRGYIDAVMSVDRILRVRDYKTGNNPGDDFQLAVYAIALSETYNIPPPLIGDYWMGRSGKPTVPYDLSGWTREKVSARFRELDENINAGRFEPKPSPSNCQMCSVKTACEYREA